MRREMMTGKIDKRTLVEKKRRNSFDMKNRDNDGDGEDDSGGDNERRNVNFHDINKERFYKNRSSSSSGSGSGSEKNSARGSERGGVSRSHVADNTDELKVVGGTIYVLNFNGKRVNIMRYKSTSFCNIFMSLPHKFFFIIINILHFINLILILILIITIAIMLLTISMLYIIHKL